MKILKPENIDFNSFSSIIFDWGGVITNIDYQATTNAFIKLGLKSIDKYLTNKSFTDLFLRLEIGKAEPEEVLKRLVNDIGREISMDSFIEAFCAMILDTPPQRITILKNLSENYRIFLLSNTNIIHTEFFKRSMHLDFTGLFEKIYYSNIIHMRKPDKEIYEFVLQDAKLNPGETLFIDDTEPNIRAADELGMQVFHMTPGNSMEAIFRNWSK
jgi:putative hydrolase of the HAD superfamily